MKQVTKEMKTIPFGTVDNRQWISEEGVYSLKLESVNKSKKKSSQEKEEDRFLRLFFGNSDSKASTRMTMSSAPYEMAKLGAEVQTTVVGNELVVDNQIPENLDDLITLIKKYINNMYKVDAFLADDGKTLFTNLIGIDLSSSPF